MSTIFHPTKFSETWIISKTHLPEGRYTISVMKTHPNGITAFKYIAHYDVINDRWHQYNPFEDTIGEIITDNVTAWTEGMGVFIE
jgi:hypothetical protein